MSRYHPTRHIRELERAIRPHGLRIERGRSHPRIVDADGRFLTPISSSPTDTHAAKAETIRRLIRLGVRPPIGKAERIWVEQNQLLADIVFDSAHDEFARSVESKYRSGVLSAVSVGWDSLQVEPSPDPRVSGIVTRAELLDISAVPVPGDPAALMQARSAYRALQSRQPDVDFSGLSDAEQEAVIRLIHTELCVKPKIKAIIAEEFAKWTEKVRVLG
jgi:hypothetical protein